MKIKGIKETVKNLQKLVKTVQKDNKAIKDVGDKILELSSSEVPLDEGTLLRSGAVTESGDKVLVGYNTTYAAKLHFHPEFRFKNGRKAFYLTDPIRRNTGQIRAYYAERFAKRYLM